MRIAVLGTGMVGVALASRLLQLGHEVRMGAREAANPVAADWASTSGGSHGDLADAAGFGEIVVNATHGLASVEALTSAGADTLAGKVVVDVSNPLDFSTGSLVVRHDDGISLGERIATAFPDARVVKAMNMMNADLMLDPSRLSAPSSTMIAGDDPEAKAVVHALLVSAGWLPEQVLDLGGITAARGMELYLPLVLTMFGALGTAHLNIAVVR